MTDPIPYNLTIPSQDASLVYSPQRGTSNNTADGWVLSYSGGLVPAMLYWGRKGIGADYRATTKAGSSVQLTWVGTGIYFYGNATKGSYRLTVNGKDIAGGGADVPNGGLLASTDGLPYDQHTAFLSVVGQQPVAFQYAQATIGFGYPGNTIRNRTVQAVLDDGKTLKQNDQFFNFAGGDDTGGWAVENNATAGITFPNGTETKITYQMKTRLRSDTLRFNVSKASGFVLWGSMFSDHHPKQATLRPGPPTGPSPKITPINDFCTMLDFQQVLYWESGLDYNTQYMVEIANTENDRDSILAFNKLDLLDGGPAPPVDHSSSSFQTKFIAAIVVPVAALLAALVAGVIFWRRRRRLQNLKRFEDILDSPAEASQHSIEPFPLTSHTAVKNRDREVDAGPLPPQYDSSWVDGSTEPAYQGEQEPEQSETSEGSRAGATTPSRNASPGRKSSPLPPIPKK